MVSGALAVGRPSPVLDVVTRTAYLADARRGDAGAVGRPGTAGRRRRADAAVPLAGVVVSYCLGFGVLLLLLGGLALGRPLAPLEAATVVVLMALTFVRTLVWARGRRPADPSGAAHRGLLPHPRAPLGRRHDRARRPRPGHLGVERPGAPAGRRATSRAGGCATSSTTTTGTSWTGRSTRRPDWTTARRPVFRLRGRDGVVAAVRDRAGPSASAGCPAPAAPGQPRTAWCCTCATWPAGAATSWSSSGWPTPTT